MLARVAENIYWLSRYLERAENTVRLMHVHSNLLMDLPGLDDHQSWIPRGICRRPRQRNRDFGQSLPAGRQGKPELTDQRLQCHPGQSAKLSGHSAQDQLRVHQQPVPTGQPRSGEHLRTALQPAGLSA